MKLNFRDWRDFRHFLFLMAWICGYHAPKVMARRAVSWTRDRFKLQDKYS